MKTVPLKGIESEDESAHLWSNLESILAGSLPQQEYRSFPSSVGKTKASTWTTHASRARETHVGRIMNINRDAHGGLVSNPSDREIQGISALTAQAGAAPVLNVSNLSWDEPHAGKRDIGDLNNRTLIDLTAAGIPIPAHSYFNWLQVRP